MTSGVKRKATCNWRLTDKILCFLTPLMSLTLRFIRLVDFFNEYVPDTKVSEADM